MKFAPLAVLGLAVAAVAMPAAAQTAAPATPAAPAATAKFTLDTPIEVLVADAGAKAVLDANLPGMTSHPAFEQFKSLSLNALAPYSQGMITPEILAKIATDLAAIK